MSVQSTVEDDRYVHSEKLEESSEHRDAFALNALSRTSRWIKHFGKVNTNIETDQNCENVVESIETDQHCGKFVESVGTDRHLEKWFRSSRWMTQAKNSERDTVKLVQNMLTDQKLRNGKLKEFVQSLLMVEHEEYGKLRKLVMSLLMNRDLERESMNELMAKSLMDRRLTRADAAKVKSVNESGSVQNSSEHDVGQVIVQEKFVTIWLLDTRAVTHVMPKCLWEQLGELALQTTNITLRGAN